MKIGLITARELPVFRTLLLPETAGLLEQGVPITALGLTQERLAIGALAGAVEDECFHIRSLYVAPEYRRRGGGRILLEELLRLLPGLAYSISVSFTVTLPEHEALEAFFASLGFRKQTGGNDIYAATLRELCDIPFFSRKKAVGGSPFCALSSAELSQLQRAAHMAGAPMPTDGLRHAEVDTDVSTALFESGIPCGYAVVCRRGRFLSLDGIWANTPSTGTAAAILLRSTMLRIREKYPPDTVVLVQTISPSARALLQKLYPDCRTISAVMYRPLQQAAQ